MPAGYFINESNNSGGYWEPHSASIDFCESNYVLTHWIAEPHNVFSSLWGLSLFGAVGMYYGCPTGEARYFITSTVLFLIGLGSAALHTTLHWTFQSADELPMIYLVICGVYNCLEIDSPLYKLNYPGLEYAFFALAAANTLIYYQFQQIYALFLLTFAIFLVWFTVLHIRLSGRHRQAIAATGNPNSVIASRYYVWHVYVFCLAFPLWVVDQLGCALFLPFYDALPWPLTGCTLHIWWHSLAGLGVHFLCVFFCVSRMDAVGKETAIRTSMGGLMPYVVVVGPLDAKYKVPAEPPKDKKEPPKDKQEPPKEKEEPPKDKQEPPKDKKEPPKDKQEPPKDKQEPPKDKEEPPKDKNATTETTTIEKKNS